MYLYFGDDDATRAAAYLCGVMTHERIPYVRVNSSETPPDSFGTTFYDVYILSDYPRVHFSAAHLETIRDAVFSGAGLIMIGGWESFHGRLGEYHNTGLTEILPVEMRHCDDRRNFPQGVVLSRKQDHPILDGLPWDRPPLVGGLNEFTARPDARVLLEGLPLELERKDGTFEISIQSKSYPVLVTGEFGQGRTAALATDVAPHWVGGLVDWGSRRIMQDLPDGGFVEVGEDYVKFFANLLRWAACGRYTASRGER